MVKIKKKVEMTLPELIEKKRFIAILTEVLCILTWCKQCR